MNLIQIENRSGKVKLNDAVNPWSSDDLISEIERLYGAKAVAENFKVGEFYAKADDALETLEIEINSPGGSVLDGYRVYHSLVQMRERGVKVVATGNGIIASMASVIFMAADERRITQGSRLMIHEAQQTVSGDAEDHARSAKILDEMSDEIAGIYASVTNSPKEEMRDLMKKETWMGAQEAVDRRFADSVIGKITLDSNANKVQKQATNEMSILERLLPNSELQAKLDFANGELLAKDSEIQNLTAKLTEADHLLASAVDELKEFKAKAESAEVLVKAEAEAHNATKQELESAKSPEAIVAAIESAVSDEESESCLIKTAVNKLVTNQVVSAGHPPLETGKAESEETQFAKISREAFRNLGPIAKSEFVRKGGKIID